LEPYFGHQEFAFVCGWAAQPGEPARATGLKLVFPSPTLWFPLRPTRVYANPVGTVVYVRDMVKPAEGCDLPGLRCEYVYGIVEPRSVSKAFAAAPRYDRSAHYADAHYKTGEALLTRVTLTDNPQVWDRDLELVPGASTGGQVSLAITGWVQDVGLGWSALLGALLGLFLPRLTVPRADRSWADYLGGALTGAAILFTVWASALVFAIWRSARFREGVGPPRRYLAIFALAVVHFLIVLAIYVVLVVGFVRGS
jgi:hypothetical protein